MKQHVWHIPVVIEATMEVSYMEPIDEVTAENMAISRATQIVKERMDLHAAPGTNWSITVGKDWPVRVNNQVPE